MGWEIVEEVMWSRAHTCQGLVDLGLLLEQLLLMCQNCMLVLVLELELLMLLLDCGLVEELLLLVLEVEEGRGGVGLRRRWVVQLINPLTWVLLETCSLSRLLAIQSLFPLRIWLLILTSSKILSMLVLSIRTILGSFPVDLGSSTILGVLDLVFGCILLGWQKRLCFKLCTWSLCSLDVHSN